MATLDERVAALEARLGPAPLATVPPIQIGSLTNVPAPGSQLAAQWAQDASGLVVHRFSNRAALDSWAAPVGALAVTVDDGVLYRRKGGQWSRLTPYLDAVVGVGLAGLVANTWTNVATLSIPSDSAARVVDVQWHLRYDRWPPYAGAAQLLVDGVAVTQWDFRPEPEVAPGDGAQRTYMAALAVKGYPLATGHAVPIVGRIWSNFGTSQTVTYASGQYNRLAVSAVGA